jgi:hypothetical protein
MFSIILNLVTIMIVGIFALFVYVAYRQRPDLTATPVDIMRDIVGGQSTHARIHKVVPYKRLMQGPMGEFGDYDTNEDLAPLEGNMSDYKPGTMPWENAENENFGSRTGVPRTDK